MSFPDTEFGALRSFFWPIYRHELKKVIPMMLMAFLICFNYSILKSVKDTVIITAKSSGAEVLPFIKVWILLPMAILFTLAFTRLSNRFSQEKVFYLIISSFLIFFALFTFVFCPNQERLLPHQSADYLEQILPAGFRAPIAMFRNWGLTIFYVISELWGSMVLSVLFWGFINEVTKINEARRFYSMLGVVSSLAATLAGVAANYLANDQSWEKTLQVLMWTIISCGTLTMAIFSWMNKKVLNDKSFDELHKTKKELEQKKKKKLSMRESFSYLSNSKYLICIAILVICYNLVINLVEVVWKDQLDQLCDSKIEFNRYMNNVTIAVGFIATLASLFMPKLIYRFGWTYTALITPIIMLVTSTGFFLFMFFQDQLSDFVLFFTGMTPLAIAVFFGASQVCMSKACKYSVFDSTKEMAFIPLEHESKLKGKAAIDGVGSRFGKSGGSMIHQVLFLFLGTVSAGAPYVAAILLAVIICWIAGVRSLGKQFAALMGKEEQEEIGESRPEETGEKSSDTASPLAPVKVS